MKKILSVCLILLSNELLAASTDNFGFVASNNQDPIFIEKCSEYRNAKLANDITTLLTFVDPKFLEKDLIHKATKHVRKVSKKYNKHFGGKSYQLSENRLVENSDESLAGVKVVWRSEKSSFHEGCAFDKITSSNKWKIRVK